MKRISFLIVLITGLGLLLPAPTQAQTKLATVDLRKVFDDYYKTKAADTKLKEQATDLRKENKAYMDQHEKGVEQYKKLLEDANNQAVSADEREKRKKAAESKLLEIKELEQTIRQFEKSSETTLREQQRQMREKILAEIRAVITSKAKAGGFTIVVDTAAESLNQAPVILYTTGENDLTTAVLAQLNATAPAASRP